MGAGTLAGGMFATESSLQKKAGKTVDWLIENRMEWNLVDAGGGFSFAYVGRPSTLHGYNEGGIVAITKLIKEFEGNNGTVMFLTKAHPLSCLADYLFVYKGTGTEQDNILMNIYINLIAIAFREK